MSLSYGNYKRNNYFTFAPRNSNFFGQRLGSTNRIEITIPGAFRIEFPPPGSFPVANSLLTI